MDLRLIQTVSIEYIRLLNRYIEGLVSIFQISMSGWRYVNDGVYLIVVSMYIVRKLIFVLIHRLATSSLFVELI